MKVNTDSPIDKNILVLFKAHIIPCIKNSIGNIIISDSINNPSKSSNLELFIFGNDIIASKTINNEGNNRVAKFLFFIKKLLLIFIFTDNFNL
jgi:hypothetical protein